ncbi:MAG: hypothetical protein HQL40_21150, partial [Alphaproteobacteria bacterium]|nr:hypothetical protein [Alphaproteobacteria bacterium]
VVADEAELGRALDALLIDAQSRAAAAARALAFAQSCDGGVVEEVASRLDAVASGRFPSDEPRRDFS